MFNLSMRSLFGRLLCVVAVSLGIASGAGAATVSLDGFDVFWESEGEGIAVVFVHGWTCDTTVWSEQWAELAGDYRVIALDLPGHGQSGSPSDLQFTTDLYAAAIEAVRIEAGEDRIILVGHSMGAPVISQYALNYPRHAAGLVAVDGPIRLLPGQVPPMQATREIREQMITGMFVPATSESLRSEILDLMLRPTDEMATAVGSAMGTFAANPGDVIEVPALVIAAGNQPADVVATGTDSARELVPNIRVEQIPGTGHFLMLERPDVFNELLRGFLESLRP